MIIIVCIPNRNRFCLDKNKVEGKNNEFNIQAFVDEIYITLLARLLCANILEKSAFLIILSITDGCRQNGLIIFGKLTLLIPLSLLN